MISLVRVLILLIFLLVPLLGPGDLGYEQTKVLFFIIITSVTGFLWLYLIIQGKVKIAWNQTNKLCLIFIIWLLVASIFGSDPKASIFGKQPYIQGWILYLYFFILFLIIRSIKISKIHLAAALSLSAIIVSYAAIKDWMLINIFGFYIPTYAGRVVSTFGQPNFYSGFLLIVLPFIYYGRKSLSFQKFYLTALMLSVVGILASESRASIIILFGLMLFWLLKNLKYRKLAFGIYGFFIAISFIFFVHKEILQPSSVEWLFHNAPEKRAVFWPVLFEQYSKKWIAGYGLENIDTSFAKYEKFHEQRSPAYFGIKNLIVDRSHNYILDLLIFSGIFGTLIWILLVVSLLRKAKGVLLLSLIIYLLWIQLQNQSVVHLMYFWLVAGLIDQQSNT